MNRDGFLKDLIDVVIPPERRVTEPHPPAALPEGVKTSLGAKDKKLVRGPLDLRMAAIAAVDETRSVESLTPGSDGRPPPEPDRNGGIAPCGDGVAGRAGFGRSARCRCRPRCSSAGSHRARRSLGNPPSRSVFGGSSSGPFRGAEGGPLGGPEAPWWYRRISIFCAGNELGRITSRTSSRIAAKQA